MEHVNIAQRGERLCISADRLQPFHGNLNVNDRFRLQTRNRRRADVVDATREFSERTRGAIPFRLEFQNPAWIVRRDLQSVDHDCSAVELYSLTRPETIPSREAQVPVGSITQAQPLANGWTKHRRRTPRRANLPH